jgi:hypothetical protein
VRADSGLGLGHGVGVPEISWEKKDMTARQKRGFAKDVDSGLVTWSWCGYSWVQDWNLTLSDGAWDSGSGLEPGQGIIYIGGDAGKAQALRIKTLCRFFWEEKNPSEEERHEGGYVWSIAPSLSCTSFPWEKNCPSIPNLEMLHSLGTLVWVGLGSLHQLS